MGSLDLHVLGDGLTKSHIATFYLSSLALPLIQQFMVQYWTIIFNVSWIDCIKVHYRDTCVCRLVTTMHKLHIIFIVLEQTMFKMVLAPALTSYK